MRTFQQVYVISRIDFFNLDALRKISSGFRSFLKIKEVVSTLEEAEEEVERLNQLNASKDVRYFWQAARFYPAKEKT